VEMIKRVAPERLLGGSISAMAFVGDDQIKCMDRNRQRLGQILFVVVAAIEASIWKEIPGHALDGADVDERGAKFRISQMAGGHHLGIKFLARFKVVLLESLAIDLVDLVEFQPGLRFERSELT